MTNNSNQRRIDVVPPTEAELVRGDTVRPASLPPIRPSGGTTREDLRRDTYTPAPGQIAAANRGGLAR
jgi:hypothetical protein